MPTVVRNSSVSKSFDGLVLALPFLADALRVFWPFLALAVPPAGIHFLSQSSCRSPGILSDCSLLDSSLLNSRWNFCRVVLWRSRGRVASAHLVWADGTAAMRSPWNGPCHAHCPRTHS